MTVFDLDRMDKAASIGALALAIWLAVTGGRPQATSADHPVDETLEKLATAVLQQARQESARLQVRRQDPLRVMWSGVEPGIGAAPADVLGYATAQAREVRLRGGAVDDAAERFLQLPHRQAVVLGDAGAGKSVLAQQLILGVLERRNAADPVPVWVSLPALADEHAIADRLLADYPVLGAADLVTEMITTGRIVLVLDGLDEVEPPRRPTVFRVIRDLADQNVPLVLTSRTAEYRDLVSAEGEVLPRAAVVSLVPVQRDAAFDYLRGSGQANLARWQEVQAALDRDPGLPVGEVLASPLYIALARRIYAKKQKQPRELIEAGRFSTADDIRLRLLDDFVPTAYDGRPDVDRVRRCLRVLARLAGEHGRDEISWWKVRDGTPRPARALLAGVIGGLAVGLLAGVVYGLAVVIYACVDLQVMPSRPVIEFGLQYALPVLVRTPIFFGIVLAVAVGMRRERKPILRPAPWPERLTGIRKHMKQLWPYLLGVSVGAGSLALTGEKNPITVAGFLLLFLFAVVGLRKVEDPEPGESSRPRTSLRADRAAAVRLAVLVSAVVALGTLVALSDESFLALTSFLPIGISIGVTAALVRTAWGHWLIAGRPWLVLHGLRRPIDFLEDAHQRGVFRRSGAAYQFRHEHLRRYLAGDSRGQAPEAAARTT